jgi:hypothetical protein
MVAMALVPSSTHARLHLDSQVAVKATMLQSLVTSAQFMARSRLKLILTFQALSLLLAAPWCSLPATLVSPAALSASLPVLRLLPNHNNPSFTIINPTFNSMPVTAVKKDVRSTSLVDTATKSPKEATNNALPAATTEQHLHDYL